MLQLTARRRTAVVALAAALGLSAACSTDPEPPAARMQQTAVPAAPAAHAGHQGVNNGELTPAQKQAVAQVRNATVRFHDIEVAKKAGYVKQYPPGCAESPEGAQAFHYLDTTLVDTKVELLRPELLMYEPGPDGTMHLIGVDYIVPLDQWTSKEPPTLLGVPFLRNEPLGVWALHIWAWRPNPSGMFAAWNPKVSCEYAK